MTLVAEIWVSHPDIPLRGVLGSDSDQTLWLSYQTKAEPDDRFLFVRATVDDREAFERALEADDTVSEHKLVAMFPEHDVYRVGVTTDVEVVPSRSTALGAEVLEVVSHEDGWQVRMHLLTRDAFDAFRDYCRDRNVTYRVQELSNIDSVEEEYTFGLTETQRTTLLLAYDAGYYDIPRTVSQEDLADQLGISKSAVSQRLRRATELLVEHTLVSDER